jgi:hypothetical protein
MTNEMQAARRIQTAILPLTVRRITGYSVAARYSPITAIAGLLQFSRTRPNCVLVFAYIRALQSIEE